MAKIIVASTLALAISMGGAFWGNGAQASTSSAKLQTEQWMWNIGALADHGGAKDKESNPDEDDTGGAPADTVTDGVE
ncbi:hypothetical protein [Cohnella sp. 56]|uniref:hypothetical protein n=1 Tax=Cohnella sp. 56 TaxID=3113722 RepID=UPI0030E85B9C